TAAEQYPQAANRQIGWQNACVADGARVKTTDGEQREQQQTTSASDKCQSQAAK
ncbi:unnamed protein product, partial [Citrullus colocynthis]